jgi:DNA-binding HxlR family transcriptional regulator
VEKAGPTVSTPRRPDDGCVPDPVFRVVDVLARRGSLDVFAALTGGGLAEAAIEARLRAYDPSVVTQRVADLRRLGVVEIVPETGELRLSAGGRRLQGHLDRLRRWADDGR